MVFGIHGPNHDKHADGAHEDRGREGRGRENVVASGRGGAGNMFRSPSRGRPEDTAGDAAKASAIKNASVLHSGRGGVGNVRSPSRDPTDRLKLREAQEKETHIQEDYLREEAKHTHSSGRGGIGNRTRDESQERGRGRGAEKDTGGGSVGNILRSLSRSRSREPRSSGDSPNRTGASAAHANSAGKLPQVNELESVQSKSSSETAT